MRSSDAARGQLEPRVLEEARRLSAARLERWRRLRHFLSPPAVDWSARANRRREWTPPATPARNPHLPTAARSRSPATTTEAGTGQGTPEMAVASTLGPPDTIRVAFLRIDFRADRDGDRSTGDGRFDLSGPDTLAPPIDRPPHNRTFCLAHLEALRRFYDAQSYGRTVIEGDVWPRSETQAYSVSDMADFGPWDATVDLYAAAVHMFRTMMFAADSQSIVLGDRIPWDAYDRFMIIHAGSDAQSDVRFDSPLDIPSFTVGLDDTNVVIFPDSTNRLRPIDRCAFVPETEIQDGFYSALNGVIAHENGHNLFGMYDVYDVNSGYPVTGLWSLMDAGNLAGSLVELRDGSVIFATGLLPPSVDPFQRFFTTDTLDFVEPSWGDTMAVTDIERHPDVRRVFLSSDEYLLLENRHLAPADTVDLDQDMTTRVVLGPKRPDRFEYDALLPGGGMVVWHIDASVIPFTTALRVNPDYGFNSNPARRGETVIEADGLGDLGDISSPFVLGSPFDPYFRSNNPSLSDSTTPNLSPHIGTRPHVRLDFLDDPGPVMRFSASRTWQLAGWPAAGDFPPGGPVLLATDLDGDRSLEVCWAGGAIDSPDSAALFAVRVSGRGVRDSTAAFAHLDRRPRAVMAALPLGEPGVPGQPLRGPSYFAVTTFPDGPDTSFAGGRVWLVDSAGAALPGWPPPLPSIVTTPPVIAGFSPNATVYVGCADGHVYALRLDGSIRAVSGLALAGGVSGRLAVDPNPVGAPPGMARIAAGGGEGDVAALDDDPSGPFGGGFNVAGDWPQRLGGAGFEPDFLWLDFDGRGRPATEGATCGSGERTLIAHYADRLWAFCPVGNLLPGWGRALGDTLVASLGAGDPDGDGYAEVLTQSTTSRVAFWNQSGYPSPGWPRRATHESLRTDSPPLLVDVDGDGRGEVVAMNGSGIVAALTASGGQPTGWPLASGSGVVGSPVAADLDRDGTVEIVVPDRAVTDSLRDVENSRFGSLYAYSLPTPLADPIASAWTMVGGDPGRTSTLDLVRTAAAGPPSAGPLVRGSLKVFPNPARRRPVAFAYQLSEPADVEFKILDTSGHEVASFRRAGRRADNLEVWDPGEVPAGLYLARLKFRSAGSEQSEVMTVGLIR
ncbi:MAG TPA: FG-GAP-like repeat-containing protein [Candidatus Eisenbacteria bacterium]